MKFNFVLILILIPGFLFPQSKSLNLDDCRQIALIHNRKVKIADENELMMSSIYKSAKTQHYPRFGANGTYIRTNRAISLLSENIFLPVVPQEAIVNGKISEVVFGFNQQLLEETFVTDENGNIIRDDNGNPVFQKYAYLPADQVTLDLENVFLFNVSMKQPIYMGGKIREINKMASYGEDLFGAKKTLTKSEVILETDKRYWQVIALQEKVKLTTIYKQMLGNLLTDLNNIYEEGIITNNEILKAKVKFNEVDLKLLKSTNGLQLARMALNQTLGFPLDTIVQLSDTIILNRDFQYEKETSKALVKNRPEIEMLNSTIKIAESAEKIMRSRYLPNVGLTANYLFMNPNPYNGFEKEFGGDWNVGVVVNIPIWHWNDKKYTLQATKHKTNALREQYEETQELITLEIQQTKFKYSESIKKVEMTSISLQQAEENLKITQDNFNEGVVNTTDLLEAQTMWQEAYSEFIEAKTENKLCESELLRVTGQLNY
ncbi:TolC family protein [Bacteroidota bacterium]